MAVFREVRRHADGRHHARVWSEGWEGFGASVGAPPAKSFSLSNRSPKEGGHGEREEQEDRWQGQLAPLALKRAVHKLARFMTFVGHVADGLDNLPRGTGRGGAHAARSSGNS